MYDGESTKNIHYKRLREETSWNAEASHELLRLRFQQLRDLFDDVQTVEDVHEAWDVVASTLSNKTDWGLQVDAVQCSDQLTKLRQQWHASSTNQLHVMMANCFSKNNVESQQQQHESMEQPPQVRTNFNKAMEEALMQEVEEEKTAENLLKRSKTVAVQEKEISVSPPSDPVPLAQAETLSSPEPIQTLSELASPTVHDIESSNVGLHEDRLLPAPESLEISPQPVPTLPQETLLTVVPNEEKEFHRHGNTMRALEKRSQQFDRLVQSHKRLADVTQQLMDALVNRNTRLT
ncbi:unnamed protein product [Peronospora destructor]|uniref:Uncharacterized protein n=1 Tax=Peronospora destructor TaxID=86335 RepID=A0AAV0T9J1_9STRA|nr:unnamed protein product [Peronospora destructor]